MKLITLISVILVILFQCISNIKGSDYSCFSGYHHCSGTIWCCQDGYVCTGTATCLSIGVIVGIAIGCLVGFGVFVAVICVCCCRGGRRANTNGTVLQPQGASVGQQGYPQTAYPQANYNPPPK
ncbi:Hypothetical predicted protein [Mytilus galloprovincialis]|uniref:Cysteine and tyrosine-rich protein 1 n=2 Tax=Mytilus galloprovincialis TaxID=29158 RepID=A0A8B6HNG3_MYTGA|nr:Hypothetical predicted protein [Mytilus galloprovincialis]